MRRARSLIRGQDAAYHCISRTVAGQHLFKEQERQALCVRLHRQAAFCQIQINTHTCKVRKQGGWPMKGADWGGLRSLKKIKEPMDLPAPQEP